MKTSYNKAISDEDLMILSGEGKKVAFEEIYRRYSGKIYNYFLKMNRYDQVMAQDLTQDLFLKIVQSQKDFDHSKSFKTWIFSIANNMCKNIYRHEEVVKKADREMSYTLNTTAKMETNIDKSGFKKALSEALNTLDPVKKSSFIMRYKHDLSIKEIAELTKASEGTVKSRLFYTLKQLTVSLKEFDLKGSHGK